MIEFQIDTTRLEQKLLIAARSIQASIVQGVSLGAEQLEKQIDDFMFVPLAMNTTVDQQNEQTTATIGVKLNLPPIRPMRFDRFRRNRFRRKPKVTGRRRWPEFVREIGQNSKSDLTEAVASNIRRDLP